VARRGEVLADLVDARDDGGGDARPVLPLGPDARVRVLEQVGVRVAVVLVVAELDVVAVVEGVDLVEPPAVGQGVEQVLRALLVAVGLGRVPVVQGAVHVAGDPAGVRELRGEQR
jgi:hypothetical protein